MEILHPVLGNLRNLLFEETSLTETQALNLFEFLDDSCSLKNLKLSQTDVTKHPASLLARVINKIEMVTLAHFEKEVFAIDTDQLEEIFKTMAKPESATKNLRLGHVENLDNVNSVVLAKALNHLESFEFDDYFLVRITESQTIELFKVMSVKTNLNMLGTPSQHSMEVDNNMPIGLFQYIHSVEPEVLVKAVNNLESFRLDGTFSLPLTVAFFKQLNQETRLKSILTKEPCSCLGNEGYEEIVNIK